MARIYISSTYEDLKKEREAAAKAVRRLGHTEIAMEDYVAADKRPLDKCREDVRNCDVYIGIFALRYGYIPAGYDKSITRLEYEEAKNAGKPCLVFLLDEKQALWPPVYVSTGEERRMIDQLRTELMEENMVSFFKNADELNGLVSAALGNLILMVERSFIKFKRPEELMGTRLGKYVIREKLGRGGKGVVFKVLDRLEDKEKAVKMIPPSIADSPMAFKELQREVKIATSIIHPNVVNVLGLEEYGGHFFIVMEYIEGKNLEQLLAERKEGKLTEIEVIDLMKKLARGLLETHNKNVIHRDIKPANIMVTPAGQVKILDFGISYQVTKSMTEMLGEHQWRGTWPYMAPEQLSTRYGRGEKKQVDIWGFGVTMYQLLSGEFPFANRDQIKDKDEKPYELEGVSGELRNIVMKCLEKDMKKRWKDMAEIIVSLEAITGNEARTGANAHHVEIPQDRHEDLLEVVAQKTEEVYETDKGFREADYGDGIIMVYIPEGKFTMGQTEKEKQWLIEQIGKKDYKKYYKDENPIHDIYLDGYWMGKTEVTVGQFKRFVEEKAYKTEAEREGGAYTWTGKDWEMKKNINWKNPGFKQDDTHPVVCVSWNDAKAYCDWLSTEKNLPFKLPTEAQWEKAARGADGRKYPWGKNEPDETLANFTSMVGKTSPVGSYPQGVSPYGLLDMAGNVWEWCDDWYGSDYYGKSPDRNPQGPKSGTHRVVRGGGWGGGAVGLRCANRGGGRPSVGDDSLGFRLCQDNK